MRILFTIILLFTFSLTWAQNVKMGEFSDEEINLKEVSYEPDAAAVVFWEEGESQFSSGLLVTNYLFRVKILSEAGKEHGDIRIRYYIGDGNVERISSVKAQISNLNGDQVETTKLKKENIFDVDLGEGYRETRITFPNVQVGSILEYSYKKVDKNLTFLDGWTFQNPIPTLASHYQIKMNPNLDYQTISQGYNLSTNAEKSVEYGIYKWTLRNLYSLKEEPFMKNYLDYIERIEFQLFRYKESSHVGELWKNVLNTWEKLGDELISSYRQKGYYRSNPIEKELLDADISGETQLEMASKAYYYVRDNFTAEGVDFIYADQQINQLLKTRTGSPQELSLLLMGILKSQGITCDPVLIGSKGNGRTDIVPFPFLNQFDEILLRTELDGEVKFIDLSDKDAPFGYVDLDKQVKAGLYLMQGTSAIVPLDFEGSSNVVYFSQVDFEGSDLVMNNSIRHYQHEGLNWQKTVDYLEKQKDPLDKLFAESADGMVIEDISFENTLQKKDFVTTSFKIVMESASEKDMIMFNPIKYSSFSKNPFTQEYRIFPVDFEHKFREMSSVTIKIPEGYELDDYPQDAVLTIEGSPIVFSYSTNLMNGILTVSSKLAI